MDHGLCLTEETLMEYLEGGLDPAIKAASEVHLIACDDCRGRLGFFMRLLPAEVSADERQALQAITSRWDKKGTKEDMPRRTGTGAGRFFSLTALAAVLVGGLISASYVLNRSAEPKSASEVVHLLLAQQRPFEFRLSNEPHLPIVRTRGADDPTIGYGLLAAEMTNLSADSHQMGRFYLIQKNFKRAIDYLEIAAREVGARAEVHNDLGVAYFESGQESRFRNAVQEFQRALESDPGFAPAVFNLAMLYERTGMTSQAEAEWKRYLQLDSNSPWAIEARSALQGLSR